MGIRTKELIFAWLFVAVLFLLGGVSVGIFMHQRINGITSEADLALVEGVPSDVDARTGLLGTKTLKFTVAAYRTEFPTHHANYQEVLSRLESRESIRMWVSTKQETVFGGRDRYPLYKLSVGGKLVLTYAETLEEKQTGLMAIILFGCVLLGFGASLVMSLVWILLWPDKTKRRPREETPEERARNDRWVWIVTSFIVYSCLIVAHLEARVRGKISDFLGNEPLGVPVVLFVVIVDTLLYLPMFWVLWHTTRLFTPAFREGRGVGIFISRARKINPKRERGRRRLPRSRFFRRTVRPARQRGRRRTPRSRFGLVCNEFSRRGNRLIRMSFEHSHLINSTLVSVLGVAYLGCVCGMWPLFWAEVKRGIT